MPADKDIRWRDLKRKLRKFGVNIDEKRSGSRVMLFHPNVNGKPAFYSIHPHSDNDVIYRGYIGAIRRRFDLDYDEFYNA